MLFTSVTQFTVLGLLLFVGWLFGFASHPGGKRWKNAYEEEAVGRAQDRDELDSQLRAQDKRIAALEQEKTALEAQLAERPAGAMQSQSLSSAPGQVVEAPGVEEPAPPVYLGRITPETPAPVAAAEAQPAFAPEPVVQPAVVEQPAPPPVEPAPAAIHAEPVQVVEHVETTPTVEHVDSPPAAEPLPIKRGWFDWGKGDDLTKLRGVDGDLEARLKAENVDRFSELANLNDQEEIALERRLDLPAGYIMKEQLREQARLLADGQEDEHAQRFG